MIQLRYYDLEGRSDTPALLYLAEGDGVEPSRPFKARLISSEVQSPICLTFHNCVCIFLWLAEYIHHKQRAAPVINNKPPALHFLQT